MAKILKNVYQCDCGHSFSWDLLVKGHGDVIVEWVDRKDEKADLLDSTYDSYIVRVCCPKCKKENILKIPK